MASSSVELAVGATLSATLSQTFLELEAKGLADARAKSPLAKDEACAWSELPTDDGDSSEHQESGDDIFMTGLSDDEAPTTASQVLRPTWAAQPRPFVATEAPLLQGLLAPGVASPRLAAPGLTSPLMSPVQGASSPLRWSRSPSPGACSPVYPPIHAWPATPEMSPMRGPLEPMSLPLPGQEPLRPPLDLFQALAQVAQAQPQASVAQQALAQQALAQQALAQQALAQQAFLSQQLAQQMAALTARAPEPRLASPRREAQGSATQPEPLVGEARGRGRRRRGGDEGRQAAILPTPVKAQPALDGVARTTVMMRNMPNNQNRTLLMALLDSEGFNGRYDFLYLPMDFKTKASLGYAFVNLESPEVALRFMAHFDGFSRWAVPSRKVCGVSWSDPHQGLEQHIARYRNSPVMHEDVQDSYRPVLLQQGQRVPFPPPTRKLRAPQLRD